MVMVAVVVVLVTPQTLNLDHIPRPWRPPEALEPKTRRSRREVSAKPGASFSLRRAFGFFFVALDLRCHVRYALGPANGSGHQFRP